MGDGLEGLDAWVARQRADDAIEARARAGWLRRQAEEEATWLGVLRDLIGDEVTLATAAARTWHGIIVDVGVGYLAIEWPRHRLLARPDAVAWVKLNVRRRPPTGDQCPQDNDLALALTRELHEEPAVTLWFGAGAEPMRGHLVGVSREVVTVRPAHGPATVVARLQSVSEVLLATSG